MKRFLPSLFLLIVLLQVSVSSYGQSAPPTNLTDQNLRTWLKQNWFDGRHNQLGYNSARSQMYSYIDSENGHVYCVYTGFNQPAANTTYLNPINAEHTVPQSWFGKAEPMRSDLHHLYPTHGSVNSSRSSYPFGENTDSNTDTWFGINSSGSYVTSSSKPSSNSNNYSEKDGGIFEPREDHKGNLARAIFYFYTMYPTQAGSITRVVKNGDINTLYQWHLNDPVDATERQRNDRVGERQGNRNPYIDYPDAVARAWGFAAAPPAGAANLFISEYIEGSSYNKAIEIANFTGTAVNLSGYSLKKQSNGAGSWSTYNLSGTIANGDVYVIAHSSASYTIRSKADRTVNNSVMSFNGNDPIALYQGSTRIDIVGNYNGGSSNFAKDRTLIRKSSVTGPSTNYQSNQWTFNSRDYSSDLGRHTFGGSNSRIAQSVQGLEEITLFKAYPNPTAGSVTVEIPDAVQARLHIYAANGKLMQEVQLNGAKQTIDIRALPNGIYLIKAIHANGVHTSRIVKQ